MFIICLYLTFFNIFQHFYFLEFMYYYDQIWFVNSIFKHYCTLLKYFIYYEKEIIQWLFLLCFKKHVCFSPVFFWVPLEIKGWGGIFLKIQIKKQKICSFSSLWHIKVVKMSFESKNSIFHSPVETKGCYSSSIHRKRE